MKALHSTVCLLLFCISMQATPPAGSPFIKVDQFGYPGNAQKIAVISNPVNGYNNGTHFTPGPVYQVRDWFTNNVVYSGPVVAWNSGTVQAQSGDQAWWFDFSPVITPGSYYLYDSSLSVASYRFEINDCVYNPVLAQAMRMFYYARCGSAKLSAYATAAWSDGACHTGTLQDTDCRLYNNSSPSTSKDLHGGWHDAGDYNKYVNFTWSTLSDLLLAYEENPGVWTDDYSIPESGNGIPDLLDEIKYELDWLLRMQQSDGSVLSVIGGGDASPPSADGTARKYGPANTSSALTCSALFALAAIQYNAAGQTTYAATLQTASINAFNWAQANPNVTFYNSGTLAAGEQEIGNYDLVARNACAAVYLYALTGNATYKTIVDTDYSNFHLIQWTFAYPFEGPEQDALLYYAKTPGATASVKSSIRSIYSSSLSTNNTDNLPAYLNQTDAYMAWLSDNNYTWNSNQTKSKQAHMFQNMNVHGLDAANAQNYTNAAAGFVHYFHGVNPNSKTYLSNMGNYGAENSVTQFYNAWYANGSSLWDETGVSTYGPPPGYIPGGPNPTYALDACCPNGCGSSANNALCNTNVSPPMNQPIQKSYKDFNDSWPVNSWTISEAGIYTNAAYVRMLSKFCSATSCTTAVGISAQEQPATLVQTIYPQPAENKMTLRFYTKPQHLILSLYDLNGRELFAAPAASAGHLVELDLSGIASGIYFLKIISEASTETRKIIKE